MVLDVDMIACPRCRVSMDPFIKRGGAAEVPALMCLECGGLWLDGKEVRRLYPGLAAVSRASSAVAAEPVRPILACPRCGELPTPFHFFDVELDACPSCKGVWIDGAELADLSRTADRSEGLHAPEAGSYRDNAAEALGADGVACRECGARLGLEAAELTSRGPMCGACAALMREKLLDAELEHYEVPKNSWLPSFDDVGRGLRDAASLLSVALQTSDRCPSCGCRHASHCGHHH